MEELESGHLRNILVSLVLAFIGTMAFRVTVPVVAFYTRVSLEASAVAVGALMAVFFAARASSALLAGRFYRVAWSTRLMVATCFAAAGLASLCYGFCRSLTEVLVIRALQGALLGYAWTTVQVIVGASAPRSASGTVYALYFALGFLGIPVANTIYALAPEKHWSILMASAILFTCSALLALLLEPLPVGGEARGKSRGSKGLRVGLALVAPVVILVFALRASTAFVMSDVMYIYLKEVYGITKSQAALVIAYASLLGLPASIALGALADRVSESLAVLLIGSMAAAGLTLLTPGSLTAATLGLTLLLISGRCLTPVSRRILLTRAKAKGIGYANAAGNIGTMISSLAAGALYDTLAHNPVKLTLTLYTAAAATMLITIAATLTKPAKTGEAPGKTPARKAA